MLNIEFGISNVPEISHWVVNYGARSEKFIKAGIHYLHLWNYDLKFELWFFAW